MKTWQAETRQHSRDCKKNDASAVDINALKILVGDNPDKHCLLLQKYTESAVVGIEQIKMALKNLDANSIRLQSHKLKSSSKSIGADELACAFQALESVSEAGLWYEIYLLVSRVHRLYGKVEIYIDNFYSRDI